MPPMRGASSDLIQRLNTISEVEKSIGNLLRHAQTCISELSKEKQISKTKMEESSQAFKKTLTFVERELSEQMMYLSHVCVGSAHQDLQSKNNAPMSNEISTLGNGRKEKDPVEVLEDQNMPHVYISEVARRYRERMEKLKKRSDSLDHTNESTHVALIIRRLLCLVGECDIDRTTCCVPMCGRVFTTVQVLAWHMSYSHHDSASKSAHGTFCFVCGIRMDSAKGKTVHLMSKHKELYLLHNEQCVYQQLPVISPFAPAAIRIAQSAFHD
ncbi:zinc finger, C2H2 type [Dictyocaulus viviparus]|uniref:Mediator of RNA polymerase II transcription subunit 11 n=1 Tax=Dictyocaulus viviparus TaxID=29172 RepID=A0A0D8XNN4_DICVI|nr:zinc finger, C2H2 type [Dictyocaulus viviparus]